MQPDPENLIKAMGLETPPIGFYDAPAPSAFAPLVTPVPGEWACVFSFYPNWLKGGTLHVTRHNYGCGGAGHWLCGVQTRSREDFVRFLVDEEGLKCSHELMESWIDATSPYRQQHEHILIGPLRETQYEHLRTVTFYVNPDQLGLLMLGANYASAPDDPPAVIAPFGSGCSQLAGLFRDLGIPQALVGATDIAMRQHLPPDILAFTVTGPMFQRLCELDEKSFLYKPFWQSLRRARQQQNAS